MQKLRPREGWALAQSHRACWWLLSGNLGLPQNIFLTPSCFPRVRWPGGGALRAAFDRLARDLGFPCRGAEGAQAVCGELPGFLLSPLDHCQKAPGYEAGWGSLLRATWVEEGGWW